MKSIEIPLTRGKVALIDEEDVSKVAGYRWFVVGAGYAATNIKEPGSGKRKMVYMHRFIADPQGRLDEVDHRDGDGFNNQRSNLRVVSHRENIRHRVKLNKNNTSGFIGVSWSKARRKWQAGIKFEGRRKALGRFDSREAAAAVYAKAACKLFGDFAPSLNG